MSLVEEVDIEVIYSVYVGGRLVEDELEGK